MLDFDPRKYYPHIFKCIIHIRKRGTEQRMWIFFPRIKIQHTNTINAPGKYTSVFRMQHNEKCHGISQKIIIGRIIQNMTENDIHENIPSRIGPSTDTNNGGNGQCSSKQHSQWNGKTKNTQSNRYEILLGQIQNRTK